MEAEQHPLVALTPPGTPDSAPGDDADAATTPSAILVDSSPRHDGAGGDSAPGPLAALDAGGGSPRARRPLRDLAEDEDEDTTALPHDLGVGDAEAAARASLQAAAGSASAVPAAALAKQAAYEDLRPSTPPGWDPACPICLCDASKPGEREVVTTACGHSYCTECLAAAMTASRGSPNGNYNRCPLCREEFSDSFIAKVTGHGNRYADSTVCGVRVCVPCCLIPVDLPAYGCCCYWGTLAHLYTTQSTGLAHRRDTLGDRCAAVNIVIEWIICRGLLPMMLLWFLLAVAVDNSTSCTGAWGEWGSCDASCGRGVANLSGDWNNTGSCGAGGWSAVASPISLAHRFVLYERSNGSSAVAEAAVDTRKHYLSVRTQRGTFNATLHGVTDSAAYCYNRTQGRVWKTAQPGAAVPSALGAECSADRHSGGALECLSGADLSLCKRACDTLSSCKGFNYDHGTSLCALIRPREQDGEQLSDGALWQGPNGLQDFYGKSEHKCGRHAALQLQKLRRGNSATLQLSSRGGGCRNVALRKPTNQSETEFGGLSSRAVDGNSNPHFFGGSSCTHTDDSSDRGAWWQVDLQAACTVGHVEVVHRGDCCGERLSRAKAKVFVTRSDNRIALRKSGVFASLDVGWHLCGSIASSLRAGATEYIRCQPGAKGRYVTVIAGPGYALSLCELAVFPLEAACERPADDAHRLRLPHAEVQGSSLELEWSDGCSWTRCGGGGGGRKPACERGLQLQEFQVKRPHVDGDDWFFLPKGYNGGPRCAREHEELRARECSADTAACTPAACPSCAGTDGAYRWPLRWTTSSLDNSTHLPRCWLKTAALAIEGWGVTNAIVKSQVLWHGRESLRVADGGTWSDVYQNIRTVAGSTYNISFAVWTGTAGNTFSRKPCATADENGILIVDRGYDRISTHGFARFCPSRAAVGSWHNVSGSFVAKSEWTTVRLHSEARYTAYFAAPAVRRFLAPGRGPNLLSNPRLLAASAPGAVAGTGTGGSSNASSGSCPASDGKRHATPCGCSSCIGRTYSAASCSSYDAPSREAENRHEYLSVFLLLFVGAAIVKTMLACYLDYSANVGNFRSGDAIRSGFVARGRERPEGAYNVAVGDHGVVAKVRPGGLLVHFDAHPESVLFQLPARALCKVEGWDVPLLSGFTRGQRVRSGYKGSNSRGGNGVDIGDEGIVGSPSSTGDPERLRVFFDPNPGQDTGSRWNMKPSEICTDECWEEVLIGGYRRGDRVKSCYAGSNSNGDNLVAVGDVGTIGGVNGTSKLHVFFERGSKWFMGHLELCPEEEWDRELAGGFRRGDVIRISAAAETAAGHEGPSAGEIGTVGGASLSDGDKLRVFFTGQRKFDLASGEITLETAWADVEASRSDEAALPPQFLPATQRAAAAQEDGIDVPLQQTSRTLGGQVTSSRQLLAGNMVLAPRSAEEEDEMVQAVLAMSREAASLVAPPAGELDELEAELDVEAGAQP